MNSSPRGSNNFPLITRIAIPRNFPSYPVITRRFGTLHQDGPASAWIRDRRRKIEPFRFRYAPIWETDRSGTESINACLTLEPIRRRSIYISSTPAVVRQMRAQIGRCRCSVPPLLLFFPLWITCLPTCNYGRFHRALRSVARSRNDPLRPERVSSRTDFFFHRSAARHRPNCSWFPGTVIALERTRNHRPRNLSLLPEIRAFDVRDSRIAFQFPRLTPEACFIENSTSYNDGRW